MKMLISEDMYKCLFSTRAECAVQPVTGMFLTQSDADRGCGCSQVHILQLYVGDAVCVCVGGVCRGGRGRGHMSRGHLIVISEGSLWSRAAEIDGDQHVCPVD